MDREQIHEGMRVRAADGEYLGTVIGIGDEHFQVEKGVFRPHDFLVPYAQVAAVRPGHVTLRLMPSELEELVTDDGSSIQPRHGDLTHEPGWFEG